MVEMTDAELDQLFQGIGARKGDRDEAKGDLGLAHAEEKGLDVFTSRRLAAQVFVKRHRVGQWQCVDHQECWEMWARISCAGKSTKYPQTDWRRRNCGVSVKDDMVVGCMQRQTVPWKGGQAEQLFWSANMLEQRAHWPTLAANRAVSIESWLEVAAQVAAQEHESTRKLREQMCAMRTKLVELERRYQATEMDQVTVVGKMCSEPRAASQGNAGGGAISTRCASKHEARARPVR